MKKRKLKSKQEYLKKGADRPVPVPDLPLLRTQRGFKEYHMFFSVFPEWDKFGCIWAAPHWGICTMAQLFLYRITTKPK